MSYFDENPARSLGYGIGFGIGLGSILSWIVSLFEKRNKNKMNNKEEYFVCSECQEKVNENDKVCPKCGADLTINEEQ